MAELTKLARPYARAIFAYAMQQKQVAEYAEILQKLASVVAKPEVMALFKDPRYTEHQLADICMAFGEKILNTPTKNLIKLLAENRRLNLLPEISRLFERYQSIYNKQLKAEVYSAIPLTEEFQKTLAETLTKRFSEKVTLDVKTKPELIGGLMIRIGDKVFDGTVRGQFDRLREELAN